MKWCKTLKLTGISAVGIAAACLVMGCSPQNHDNSFESDGEPTSQASSVDWFSVFDPIIDSETKWVGDTPGLRISVRHSINQLGKKTLLFVLVKNTDTRPCQYVAPITFHGQGAWNLSLADGHGKAIAIRADAAVEHMEANVNLAEGEIHTYALVLSGAASQFREAVVTYSGAPKSGSIKMDIIKASCLRAE